jgi:hypothetical protein
MCAAERRPRQHAPFRARPIRSHAEVTSPSALRRRLCVRCRPLHQSRANITLLEPCSIINKSCAASPCCRRPARASAPPLLSTGKRAATVPTSSSELGSCRWLATSTLSSRQVEPRCSTKSAAFGHASCAAILVDQGRPRPQRHRRATSFSPTVSRQRTSSSPSSRSQSDPLLLITVGPSRAGAPLVAIAVCRWRSTV